MGAFSERQRELGRPATFENATRVEGNKKALVSL
jgi:hypothetical protein